MNSYNFNNIEEFANLNLDASLKFNQTISLDKYKEMEDRLEDELSMVDIEALNPEIRTYPTYFKNTFDENGMPMHPDLKPLYKDIILGLSKIVVLEGGKRGGKDVIALGLYGQLLMQHPDRVHLVIGVSLEQAIRTVLDANGYGIFYTIPHGRLSRETVDGAQRVVYSFLDYYGREKQLLLYGNLKESDYKKYQGMTIGTIYCNEAILQHINGIHEAIARFGSSNMPVMITTQNPEGAMHPFYQVVEKPKQWTEDQVEFALNLKELLRPEFEKYEKKMLGNYTAEELKQGYKISKNSLRYKTREAYLDFCSKIGVPKEASSYQDNFTTSQQLQWNLTEMNLKFRFEKIIRALMVQDVIDISEDHFLYGASLKKLIYYEKVMPNPNGVVNAIDYSYYHLTIDNNLAMDKQQIMSFKKSFAKGTAEYDQSVAGIRRTVDSAVFPGFNEGQKNTFDFDLSFFDNKRQFERIIVVDKGNEHPTGIIDVELDREYGVSWVTRYKHLVQKDLSKVGINIDDNYIMREIEDLIRQKPDRSYDQILLDPSNTSLKNLLINHGYRAIGANNRIDMPKNYEKTKGFKSIQPNLIGIPLVQMAFNLEKLFIHSSCQPVIEEVATYQYLPEKTTHDKSQVLAKRDEFPDCIRYHINTILATNQLWFDKNGNIIYTNKYGEPIGKGGEPIEPNSEERKEKDISIFKGFKEQKYQERKYSRFTERSSSAFGQPKRKNGLFSKIFK